MEWDDRIGARLRPKDLHTLQIIGELGSMAKASSVLGLSQPAISKAIADLEVVLGSVLLERSARGVELTDAGRLLVERGRIIFDELRQCVRDIKHLADPTQGEIRIGATEPLTVFVAQVISLLAPSYPGIRYTLRVGDTTGLLHILRERELDVVITRWMPAPDANDFDAELIFAAPLAVLADKDHHLAGRSNLQLSELLGEIWVLPPPDGFLGKIIVDLFARRGLIRPKPLVSTKSVYANLSVVATGRALTILPARMVNYRANAAWLRALDIEFTDSHDPIAAVTVKGRRAAGPVPLFQQACREVAKLG
jgi:DNA-binding transcriptional LysR family regulator